MEKVLANHDYKALKMSLEKSELQQLHDRIAKTLAESALEEDEYYQYGYGYSSGYGNDYSCQSSAALPGQNKPEQQPGYNGQPTGGGMPGGQTGSSGYYPPSQGGQQQQKPQQPQQPGQSQQSQVPVKKVLPGAQHGRPNHNMAGKAPSNYGQQFAGDDTSSTSTVDIYEWAEGYLPCIEYDMQDYLNLATVQQALHVKPTEWQMCSDTVWNAWPETAYESKIQAYYAEIIDNYLDKYDLKLTVYSGDDDSVCGLQGTQYWLDRWKYKVNEHVDYVQWKDDQDQLGGFYSQYLTDDGDTVALHFLTVRTAGHMVPTTQPGRALQILRKYLYEFDNAVQETGAADDGNDNNDAEEVDDGSDGTQDAGNADGEEQEEQNESDAGNEENDGNVEDVGNETGDENEEEEEEDQGDVAVAQEPEEENNDDDDDAAAGLEEQPGAEEDVDDESPADGEADEEFVDEESDQEENEEVVKDEEEEEEEERDDDLVVEEEAEDGKAAKKHRRNNDE